MISWKSQIYSRVAIVIATISVLLVAVSATFTYFYKLDQQRELNKHLLSQIGEGVEKTAAISAYLNDDALAQEIANGLVNNDLILGVLIQNNDNMEIRIGSFESEPNTILQLADPFVPEELVGTMIIYPDEQYIANVAKQASFESAIQFSIVSSIIALIVGLIIQRQLTSPLRELTYKFEKQSDQSPQHLKEIDIGYTKNDEIGQLITGINQLTSMVREQFSREQHLRVHFEKLQHHFKLIFEQASAGIGIIDANNRVVTKNPALNHLCPKLTESDDFLFAFDNNIHLLSHLERLRRMPSTEQIAVDLTLSNGVSKKVLHCLFARISGERSSVRDGDGVLIEVIAYDITERTNRENKIKFEADHDALTGLLNRRAFKRDIQKMIKRSEDGIILMMIDLDKFKPINDTYGHDTGDDILRRVGETVRSSFGENNSLCCRWGGDEFIIALESSSREAFNINNTCQTLIEDLSKPVSVNNSEKVQIGASIGIVMSKDYSDDLEELLNVADKAMYKVKHKKRGEFLIANPANVA